MFSGVVKIADIDDYITPSQNCIKPLMQKAKETQTQQTQKSNKLKLQIEGDDKIGDLEIDTSYSRPDLIKLKDKDRMTAKVTLNDCLACNGCVTTAETLLIQQQSLEEFIKNCEAKDKIIVVSISNQSLISIAHYYNISEEETLLKLAALLESMNVSFLFNLNTANKLALLESYEEFKKKVLANKDTGNYIMSSECPGWICYAEKIIGQWVIPHCSEVKSGQQIMGHLIKKILSKQFNTKVEDIYHACIMQCFDKKLEASRENYQLKPEVKEVDTVISSSEIIELLVKNNFESINYGSQKILYNFLTFMKKIFKRDVQDDNIQIWKNEYSMAKNDICVFFDTDENFSSNGYTEFMMKNMIEEHYSPEQREKIVIERKTIKNSDFKEINVSLEGKEIMSFAVINGLKNIKILTKNLEKKKSKYSYIEILACPGGCLNGGGQLKSKNPDVKPRDLLKIFEEKMSTKNKECSKLRTKDEEMNMLKYLIAEKSDTIKKDEIFAAKYKEIDKSLLISLSLKW